MNIGRTLTDPVWVDTQEALATVLADLQYQPILAVDTESNSLYVYQERVCLIQISTPQTDYLIDPLAIKDLSGLAPIFANPAQEKIFHASEYDLICLKRDFGFRFEHLFDTMTAARILGVTQFGLAPLLELKLGVCIDKRYQRANWGTRPLSASMLDYARMDSHYLFELRDILRRELVENNLLALAEEDFKLERDVKVPVADDRNQHCWKVAGAQHLTPQQAAILQELCTYRDQQARKLNQPLFKVFSNELMVELTINPPQSLEDLPSYKGLNARMIRLFGADLMDAIARGLARPPLRREPRIRPDEALVKRVEALKGWRKKTAQEIKVESDVVLPREILEQIAEHNPHTSSDLANIMRLVPWRYDHFGDSIQSVLSKLEGS
jgi:Ribonuclease D